MVALPAARRTDEQLVKLYRDGSPEAFRTLHDRYRSRLLAYAQTVMRGRSRQDVEDTVQETFERAAVGLRVGDAPECPRVWLYSVARNRCIDVLRRRPPSDQDVFALSRGPATDTVAVAERRADVGRLFGDLGELPEAQRSALLMRELGGLSHAELGAALGVSVPAVKGLLVRARGGLLDAEGARNAPCEEIRASLVASHERRIKAGATARRHVRECSACAEYRSDLRRSHPSLVALLPGGPWILDRVLALVRRGAPAVQPQVPSGRAAVVLVCAAAAVVGTGRSALLDPAASRSSRAPTAVAQSVAQRVGVSTVYLRRRAPRASTGASASDAGRVVERAPRPSRGSLRYIDSHRAVAREEPSAPVSSDAPRSDAVGPAGSVVAPAGPQRGSAPLVNLTATAVAADQTAQGTVRGVVAGVVSLPGEAGSTLIRSTAGVLAQPRSVR